MKANKVANQKLLDYVDDALSKGFGKEAIIKKLKDSGYSEAQIKEAFESRTKPQEEKAKQPSPQRLGQVMIAVVAAVIILVLIYVLVTGTKPTPKVEDFGDDAISNTYYSEMLYNTQLVGTPDMFGTLISQCSGKSDFMDYSSDCNPLVLYFVALKVKEYGMARLAIEYPEEVKEIEPLLIASKEKALEGSTGQPYDKYSRWLIFSLQTFGKLSSSELAELSENYFSSDKTAALESSNCRLYWDEMFFFKDVYGIDSISGAAATYPGQSELLSLACQASQGKTYDEFCTGSLMQEEGGYECTYYKYLMFKEFCGTFDSSDKTAAQKYVMQQSGKEKVLDVCTSLISDVIRD